MKVRSQNHSQVTGSAPRADAWEYLTVAGEAESPALLAEHGAQGWELVSVVREFGTRATFYFKRRRA